MPAILAVDQKKTSALLSLTGSNRRYLTARTTAKQKTESAGFLGLPGLSFNQKTFKVYHWPGPTR